MVYDSQGYREGAGGSPCGSRVAGSGKVARAPMAGRSSVADASAPDVHKSATPGESALSREKLRGPVGLSTHRARGRDATVATRWNTPRPPRSLAAVEVLSAGCGTFD